MVTIENITYINGIRFRDVTDTTFAGFGYTYAEAVELTHGRRVYCSRSVPDPKEENEPDPAPFWMGLPKYKKWKRRRKRRQEDIQ